MAKYSVIGSTLANRRVHRRSVMPPVHIEIDGVEYMTVDWSLGGFRLADYEGERAPGDVVPVTIIATVGGLLRRHFVTAEIIRVHRGEPGDMPGLAGQYEAIDPPTIETLEGVMMDRFRRRRS